MRAVRAAVFASSSVALAAGAHRLAGGSQQTRTVLLAAVAVLFAFGEVWSRRERRGPFIAAVVLLSQAGLHAAFAYAPMRGAEGDGVGPELTRWSAMLLCHQAHHRPATAAQVNAARAALGMGPLPTPPAMHMTSPVSTGGAGMLALHLGAALVMAWWLRRGERTAWTAAHRMVATVVAAGRAPRTVVFLRAAFHAVGDVWAPHRWTFGAGLAGRGPPRALVPVPTA